MLKIIVMIGAFQVVAILLNIVRSKLMAIFLGPSGVGIISLIDQIVNLVVQASALSLPFLAVKFLSRAHSRGMHQFERSYANFRNLLLAVTLLGAALSLTVVIWHPYVLGEQVNAYRTYLIVGLLAVPLIAMQGFYRNVLAAATLTRASAGFDVVTAGTITLAVTGGILGWGILGYFAGLIVAGFVIVAGVMIYLRRKLGLTLFSTHTSVYREIGEHPDILQFAFIMYAASFTVPISYLVARYLVLRDFGEAAAGLLQSAIAISMALGLLLNPANGLYLTPIVNREIPPHEKIRAVVEFMRKLIIVVAVFAMPMVLFPEVLVVVLYSSAFLDISALIVIFVVAQVMTQLAAVYQTLLIGFNEYKVYGLLVGGGQLLIGIFAWLLVPEYGILGVGLALLLSSTAIFVFAGAFLSRNFDLQLPLKLYFSILGIVLTLLIAGTAAQLLEPWSFFSILVKAAVYAGFLAILAVLSDREELRQLWSEMHRFVASVSGQK